MNRLRQALLRFTDPMQFVAQRNTSQFRRLTTCQNHFQATERASLFMHSQHKAAVVFGDHAIVDGTIEVYANGKFSVGSHFFFGRSRLYCAHRVVIGDYVLVSDNVSIMDSDLHPLKASRRRVVADQWAAGRFPDVYTETPGSPVTISDDVWIGFGASILKGVTIGQGAIVGAGALVNADVPSWTVVAGSPARVIREIPKGDR